MPDFSPEPLELRCSGGLHGILDEGMIEVKCRHWACTRGNNVTFHTFDTVTGELVETRRYKDPVKKEKK